LSRKKSLDLLEQEIPRLRRFARSLTRDVERADDVVQECLVRAVKNIESWTPGTNMRAWLFTILRNAFLNDLRRESNSPISGQELHTERHSEGPATPEHHVAVAQIADAFELLSEEHRTVLMLVAIEGFAYEEAAEICDVPVGTIRSRLSRARQTLRSILDADGQLTDTGDG